MILATTDRVEGKRIVGEIPEYAHLLAQSREESVQRMTRQAEDMGANAIVGVRFITASVMQGAAEMLTYGTAVVVEDKQP